MPIDFKLYLITDRHATKLPLPDAVRLALQGGVRAVQLREKDLPIRELLALAQELRTITKEFNARLFINDHVDVAIAVNADGVHLGHESMPVEAVRKIVGKDMLIGVSTHNSAEVKAAEAGGADFITYGPIFETASKKQFGPPVGLDHMMDIKRDLDIPLFAIGGIKTGNLARVFGSGAFGVALISAILSAEDIKEASRKLIEAISFIDKIICDTCAPR